jgi:thioredoxin 1
MKNLKDADFSKEIAKGVMLAPILEQVDKEIQGKATIAKVDIDTEQNTASQFQITSVPTMILFKEGKEVKRIVGLKNAETIKEMILSAL